MVVNTILGYLGSVKRKINYLQNKMVISLFVNFKMRYNNINLLPFSFLSHQ